MPRIESYLGPILVFVGVCLIGSTVVATFDWLACRVHGGGEACRASRDTAMGAFIGAANVGLGIAVRTSRTPEP